jgi:hypothetical protein
MADSPGQIARETTADEEFGTLWSAIYDQVDEPADPAMIRCLEKLSNGGPVLELGVGTGRIALSLQAQGIEVHGVDVSPQMLAVLRTKPGGDKIIVSIGDMAALDARLGPFRLVYVANNGIAHLLSQERQLACFSSVRRVLAPEAHFVVEGYLPRMEMPDRGGMDILSLGQREVRLRFSRVDAATQMIRSQILSVTDHGSNLLPMVLRYAWPSELDLMANLAGLRLVKRWGGWKGEPFNAPWTRHVTIYECSESNGPA